MALLMALMILTLACEEVAHRAAQSV